MSRGLQRCPYISDCGCRNRVSVTCSGGLNAFDGLGAERLILVLLCIRRNLVTLHGKRHIHAGLPGPRLIRKSTLHGCHRSDGGGDIISTWATFASSYRYVIFPTGIEDARQSWAVPERI